MTIKLSELLINPGAANAGSLGGGVEALLHEIAQMLDRLEATGEPQAIDLRSLPLAPGERERLEAALGTGEVEAVVTTAGKSVARETAVPGVWWVTHHNTGGSVVAELIEVTRVPEIVIVPPGEPGRGARTLRARLAPREGAAATQEKAP